MSENGNSDIKSLSFSIASAEAENQTDNSSNESVRERDLRNADKEFNLPVDIPEDFVPPRDNDSTDDKHTMLINDRITAVVGSSLVSSTIKRDGKLFIAMVGLPVRGKTLIAKSLKRHFDWIGLKSELFSAVEYRREKIGIKQPHYFFGKTGKHIREKVVEIILEEAIQELLNGIDIAIFDASNITKERRKWLVDRVQKYSKLHAHVIFVESICEDPEIIKEHIEELKKFSPEFKNMDSADVKTELDLRMAHYHELYEPLDKSEGYPFVKFIDSGRQLNINLMNGYLPGKILMLMMNHTSRPRTIFMTRHGGEIFH